jgi:hypothetical protein
VQLEYLKFYKNLKPKPKTTKNEKQVHFKPK